MTGKEKCPVMVATTSQSNQNKIQSKDSNYFDSELNRVDKAFLDEPSTMKEIDKRIGVMRESVCRYCAKLRKQDKLYPIRKRICNVTGHLAIEWTTNAALVPPRPKQLDLFEATSTEAAQSPERPVFELCERIIDPAFKEYLVFESCAHGGVLKLIPKTYEGPICESIVWQLVCRGTLEFCEDVIDKLTNGKEIKPCRR